jgi:hypothetical protein
MAPSAIDIMPTRSDRDGMALEDLSDDIDAVNVLKANMRAEASKTEDSSMNEKSQFDAEKDKTKFRQYEDACMWSCNRASFENANILQVIASRTSTASNKPSRLWLTTSKPATLSRPRLALV